MTNYFISFTGNDKIILVFFSSMKEFLRKETLRVFVKPDEFLSSPIACVACERLELLKTEECSVRPFPSIYSMRNYDQFFLLLLMSI